MHRAIVRLARLADQNEPLVYPQSCNHTTPKGSHNFSFPPSSCTFPPTRSRRQHVQHVSDTNRLPAATACAALASPDTHLRLDLHTFCCGCATSESWAWRGTARPPGYTDRSIEVPGFQSETKAFFNEARRWLMFVRGHGGGMASRSASFR